MTEGSDQGRPFVKMHGLRNHFVIVDARTTPYRPDVDEIVRICDVQAGVGADQLVVIEPPVAGAADAFMRLYNVDGREVEACGNATRCVAWLLLEEAGTERVGIETLAGVLDCVRSGDRRVSCNMGPLAGGWRDIPLAREVNTAEVDVGIAGLGPGVAVNVGNPHLVFFSDTPERIALEDIGPAIQADPLFPQQVNVGLGRITGPHSMDLCVYERGAGLTMACGSGACAATYAARLRSLVDEGPVEVRLPGGSVVIDLVDGNAIMTGPVSFSFRGTLD